MRGKLSNEFMIDYVDKQYDKYKEKVKEEGKLEEISELKKLMEEKR